MNIEHLPTIITSTVIAIALLLSLAWIAKKLSDNEKEFSVNLLICIFGGLIGWAFGAYLTPYNTHEAFKFETLGQAIVVFISGYFVSKFDRFIEISFFSEKSTSVSWVRLGLFASSALLSSIYVYSIRYYLNVPATL